MSNYLSTVLGKHPSSYYRLGESSGTSANDSSGNGFTGTLNGGVTLAVPGAIKRDPDMAMLFDGSSSYIALPASLQPNTSHFTVELWVNLASLSSLNNYPRLISQDDTQTNLVGFDIGLFPSGTNGAFFNIAVGGVWKQATSSTVFAPGTWYHMAFSFDGATIRIYTNGSLVGSLAASGTMTTSTNALRIGTLLSSGGIFNGFLDEVATYPVALSANQINDNYVTGTSGITIYSVQDATLYKSQVVKAYDPNGNFIDTVADAPYLSGFTESMNGATSALKVSLPRVIDAYDGTNMPGSKQTIVQGNILKWYLYGPGLPSSGLLRYQGEIDTVRPHLDNNGGEATELTITPYSQVFGDHGIVGPITYGTAGSPGTYVDTGAMFSSLFTTQIDAITGHPYGYPLTLDGSNPATTGNTAATLLQNQTLVSALSTILLLSPANYFFRPNMADNTVTFNQYSTTTAGHTLKIGQHIASMEYALDNIPRKNVIVVQGKGVQATAIGSSVAQIGQRVLLRSDNRITDTNTAQLLANGLLAFYDRPQIRTKITIPDYRGDALFGLGYDIEKFKVGQTIKILDTKAPQEAVSNTPSTWGGFTWGSGYWGSTPASLAVWGLFRWGQTTWGYNVGGVFNVPVPVVSLQYDYFSVTLELGWRQPNMLRNLYNLESRFLDASMVS